MFDDLVLWSFYVASPFFAAPWKPFVAYWRSSPYRRAYRHFRSAHADPLNIVLHLLGLLHAAAANAALLHCTDLAFPRLPVTVSGATVAATVLYLLISTAGAAPKRATAAGVTTLLVAFAWAPLILRHWRGLMWLESVVWALNVRFNDEKAMATLRLPVVALLAGRLALQWWVTAYASARAGAQDASGASASWRASSMVTAAYAVVVAASAIRPFERPRGLNIYWSGIVGWFLGLWTNTPWPALHGSGCAASLFQGVSHRWTGETANLPELAKRSGPERVGDEIAHMIFFPVLIFHSAAESLSSYRQSAPAP